MPRRRIAGCLALASVILLSGPSWAQDGGLSPTLASIKASRTVRLGYREASPPFSFLDEVNRPIGYSIELCQAVVEELAVEVDEPELNIDYVKVTPETRFPILRDKKIDLECGSTTANPERARRAAFSPLTFVAGTRLMVPRAAAVRAIGDLKGKTIVVTRGTTNEQAIANTDKKFALGLKIVTADDHEQSYQMVADGTAQAFATDDILLYGLIARHRAQDRMKVVGDFLSYEPYGLMFRKDEPAFAGVVERTFRKLATNHDLLPLYRKWFMERLPTGETLGVEISPQLEESFKVLDATSAANN
jgi:glutamate/aspartate transport system substrate-binding protein